MGSIGFNSNSQLQINGSVTNWGKNYVINGGFDRWEYATSQTSAGYGSDNMWINWNTGSTKIHSQVSSGDTERVLFSSPYFSRTVVTSVSSPFNYVNKSQYIENVTKLAGKTITISFWARADTAKNIAVDLFQHFGTGGSPSSTVEGIGSALVALTSTWQKKIVTLIMPSIIGKTLGTAGVHTSSTSLRFWFDAGSNYDARTLSLGQQSGTFDIAEVQLEEGSVSTLWTPYNGEFGGEVQACQRYYYTEPSFYSAMVANSYGRHEWLFKTPMRIAPTVSYKDYIGNVGKVTITDAVDVFTNNITISSVTVNTMKCIFNNYNLTNNTGTYVLSPTASAEL